MRVVRTVREFPCAVLLAVQFLGVLLYPFLGTAGVGRALFALFGLVVLSLVLYAVRATPALTWVAAVLALPAYVLQVAQVVTGAAGLLPWTSGFEAVLYFYATGAMILYMLDDEVVTTDELFATGAVFTLLAWGFAHVYVVLQAITPGSFSAAVHPEQARTWTELLFLSFTTLTSAGLSDVVPVDGHARSVVMIEEILGVFYVAMVVTRLIALTGRVRRR